LVAGEALDDLLAHGRRLRLQAREHLDGGPLALTQQTQQDVLGADVVVAQLQRLAEAQLEHLLRPGREGDVAGGVWLPSPGVSRTGSRTAARATPRAASALAPAPSFSWIRPSRMCSVPM